MIVMGLFKIHSLKLKLISMSKYRRQIFSTILGIRCQFPRLLMNMQISLFAHALLKKTSKHTDIDGVAS